MTASPTAPTGSKMELVQSAPAAVPGEDEIADAIQQYIPTFHGAKEAAIRAQGE